MRYEIPVGATAHNELWKDYWAILFQLPLNWIWFQSGYSEILEAGNSTSRKFKISGISPHSDTKQVLNLLWWILCLDRSWFKKLDLILGNNDEQAWKNSKNGTQMAKSSLVSLQEHFSKNTLYSKRFNSAKYWFDKEAVMEFKRKSDDFSWWFACWSLVGCSWFVLKFSIL